MKKSNVVLNFEKFRDFRPTVTKVGTAKDMIPTTSLALQPPIKQPNVNIIGVKYI